MRWCCSPTRSRRFSGACSLEGLVRALGLAFVLALGALPAARLPATLVLPLGAFKPKRMFELSGDKPSNVHLTELVERGIDFERVAYEPD